MQKRHDDLLTNRLETVADEGCVHISWNELYRWYDVKKLAAGTYRDLEARWQEVSHGSSFNLGSLKCVQGQGGLYLFPENWIKPVASAADKPIREDLSNIDPK